MSVPPASPATNLLGAPARYPRGLNDLGGGLHAWLQPNGGLGESNAGLVVGEGESLLVDTLWDLTLTRRMLDAMAEPTRLAPIRRLVNTHGDGDHCWGNQLLAGAEIIATSATAQDMMAEDPKAISLMRSAGGPIGSLADRAGALTRRLSTHPATRLVTAGADTAAGLSDFTAQLQPFDFSGITLTPPTRTFAGTLELQVGGRPVRLIEVGPAHTPGDLIVHVSDASVVFAADLLFVGVTPIMWVGPVERWIAGLDRITELQPRRVIPGHGPVSDLSAVRAMRDYWVFVAAEVRQRVATGMSAQDAAAGILSSSEFAAQPFGHWDTPERIVVNAGAIARSDRGETGRMSSQERIRLLAAMGKLGRALR